MKKLYILRGHSGSGKSSLAQEIRKNNTHSDFYEINNDDYIVKKYGFYNWNFETVQEAIKENRKNLFNLLKNSSDKKRDVVIVNSNMNLKYNNVVELISSALNNGFEINIINLKNFYKNTHNMPEKTVLSLFLTSELNEEKIINYISNLPKEKREQITIEDHKVTLKNKDQKEYEDLMYEKIKKIKNLKVTYDEKKKTYINDEFLEYGKVLGLYIENKSETYPDLRVLKYSNRVFWDNLFNDALLEMRGIVLDNDNNIIIRPFKKVFNYSEMVAKNSKYPIDIKDEDKVKVVKKINGYLGVATFIQGYEGKTFNNQVVYSSTGSLDSSYVQLTKAHCDKYEKMFKDFPNNTFLFEICDETDPHIIKEEYGEYLIGMVNVKTGEQKSEKYLDEIGKKYNVRRPEKMEMSFGELKELLTKVQHEGFMVFKEDDGKVLCKMKSPFYLISKLFGRIKDEKLEKILNKKNIDEEYYDVIEYIKENLKEFKKMKEIQRIDFVRNFLQQKYYSKSQSKIKNKNFKKII